MAYLHNNREQFEEAIELAYEQTGIIVQNYFNNISLFSPSKTKKYHFPILH